MRNRTLLPQIHTNSTPAKRGCPTKRRLKQTQIAELLGISKSYLSMILSGSRKPNPQLAERICSLLPVNSKAKKVFYTQEVRGSSPLLPTMKKYWLPVQG